MILQRRRLALLAVFALMLLASCSLKQMVKMAEEQELTVEPSPLELHGDSVKFEVSAVLPVDMLKKNRLYTIKTFYEYGDPSEELDKLEFRDTEFPNQDVEQPSITQNFSMFYQPEMKDGDLKIKGIASNLEKTKFKETDDFHIADGIITTSLFVKNAGQPVYADHGYNNKEELVPVEVEFLFEKGSSVLRRSEVKGKSGEKLDAYIAEKNQTKTVTITGSHSPEGLESVNSKLSENRAKVIKDFYTKKMKQYDYKDLADSIDFNTKVIFQDWKPFLNDLSKYDGISEQEKNEIRSIVNKSGESFEAKEKKLQKKSYYNKLMKDVYPPLRFSKTQIMKIKEKKTESEINVLANAIIKGKAPADTLSYEELMFAATLTPIRDEKMKIYEAAVKQHAKWEAHNNLGAIYLEEAMKASNESKRKEFIEKAETQLSTSLNKKENGYAMANKGALALLKDDKDKALSNYSKAVDAKLSADAKTLALAGKGTAEIKKGDYKNAIASLKSSEDTLENVAFNLALAYLLDKQFSNAEQAFENAIYINEKDADAYYCGAVTAARQGDIETVAIELKQAVELNTKFKEKAANDLEFKEFWDNEKFKSSIE